MIIGLFHVLFIKRNFTVKHGVLEVGGVHKFKSSFFMGSPKMLCLRASVPPMSDFFKDVLEQKSCCIYEQHEN